MFLQKKKILLQKKKRNKKSPDKNREYTHHTHHTHQTHHTHHTESDEDDEKNKKEERCVLFECKFFYFSFIRAERKVKKHHFPRILFCF
jgi:hypothetical protein